MTENTRLHISPLTPDLLPSILPPSVRATATDISFHEISTFPENSYGYITMPSMDADKIKKKLNGSILKGKKFKIETARPPKRQLEEATEQEAPKEKKKSKKQKSEDGVLEGFELPADRKVKRGWTDPASSKKDRRNPAKKKSKDDKKEKPQPKSKYSEKPECLFRTKIPPNRSSDKGEDDKKTKKKKKSADPIIHEFSKTVTTPSFLRDSGDAAPQTTAFEEEKGWLDDAGNVKEEASKKTRKKDHQPGRLAGTKEKRSTKASAPKTKQEDPESSNESEDWTSSSGSSSDSDSDDESEASSSEDSAGSSVEKPADAEKSKENRRSPSSSPESESEAESEVSQHPEQKAKADVPKEVHPLEALFKRPTSDATQEQPADDDKAGFSFFGNNDDIESEEETQPAEPQTPFTPFTKRDLQSRGLRSAAPTPDTSVADRHMSWNESDDMEDDEESIDTPVSKSKAKDLSAEKDETEFAKWFWENRGDNNRAWKKRRRDAAKEQRQRENRKKGMKGKS